jgi:anti-sigma factor RsiW
MTDPIAEDLISGYVDDELDGPGRAAVEAAIADTPALGGVLTEVVEAREAVRRLPMVDLPRDVLDEIMANVAAADPVATDTAGAEAAPRADAVLAEAATATAAVPADELARARGRRRFRVARARRVAPAEPGHAHGRPPRRQPHRARGGRLRSHQSARGARGGRPDGVVPVSR